MVKVRKVSLIRGGGRGGGPGFIIFLCFLVIIFCIKTSKNTVKRTILSFKKKDVVISDHFLMLWFQKDSLDTVSFRTFSTFRGGSGSPK